MELINNSEIEAKIYTIRDTKVMIDSDLAKLYKVETKVLNQAVKRNIDRFPFDFMFQLSDEEEKSLRGKHKKYNSYVFTEQGIAMLSSVLKSKTAIQVNIEIMRTFTKLREFALNYSDIINRLEELEKTIKIDRQQINYNTHKIDEAYILLDEILKDTKQIKV